MQNKTTDTAFVFFDLVENNCEIVSTVKHWALINKPCLIIEAIAEGVYKDSHVVIEDFLKYFKQEKIEKIILSYMAAHPQYPSGENVEIHEGIMSVEEKYELQIMINEIHEMKLFAEEAGCCEINKKLFFIEHMYCDKPINKMGFTKGIDENKKQDKYICAT